MDKGKKTCTADVGDGSRIRIDPDAWLNERLDADRVYKKRQFTSDKSGYLYLPSLPSDISLSYQPSFSSTIQPDKSPKQICYCWICYPVLSPPDYECGHIMWGNRGPVKGCDRCTWGNWIAASGQGKY